MFPISSSTLTTPGIVNFPAVAPTVQAAPVAPVAQVNGNTVTAVGTATDAPAQASVTVDLSPVASFLLTVSQSQQQITQLQASVANGGDQQDAAIRAGALNDATQNVVNAFNLLPSVDFDQAQPQGPSLLNNLVQSLTRQTDATQQQTAAQSLARIGVTLQPPLLSDLTGGLSLDNEVLRAAFNTDQESTTSTLQNTLATFNELATRFAEQLSTAGSAQLPALGTYQQPALTPADIAANARLDLVRAELDLVSQIPLSETAADRLAAQRASLEQPANTLTETRSPLVNPLQASTAEVIAAQNAEARQAVNAATQVNQADAGTQALETTPQANQAAETLNATRPDQAARAAQTGDAEQADGTTQANDATAQANGATTRTSEAAAQAAATADAARATAAAQAARQQSASGLGAVTAAGAQAAAQANIAQAAAANAAANNPANATDAQQASAAQTAATNVAAANAAATAASAQAQAAQNAANALSAQNNAALAAAAQARVAQSTAGTPEAAAAAAAVAAQQASAAQTTAANLAAANAAAAQASQQALAAQAAAAQAAALQLDPLRANPALAAAIAAYNISDPAVLGANSRAAQTATSAIPRVAPVGAATATGGIGTRL
jgi:hypothetical protein